MAICEVCGRDQFPYNTVVDVGKDGLRHFFCSHEHMKLWQVEDAKEKPTKVPVIEGQMDVEEAIAEEELAEEPEKPAPKRRGRPPKKS